MTKLDKIKKLIDVYEENEQLQDNFKFFMSSLRSDLLVEHYSLSNDNEIEIFSEECIKNGSLKENFLKILLLKEENIIDEEYNLIFS